jgi:hypothetical protein
VKDTVCTNAGGVPAGRGKFGRVCKAPQTAVGLELDGSPDGGEGGVAQVDGVVVTTTVAGTCTGKAFSEGFEVGACRCNSNCHTCEHMYRFGPGPTVAGKCLKCKNEQYLSGAGDCVAVVTCISAGGVPTGIGRFNRVCSGGAFGVTTVATAAPSPSPPKTKSSQDSEWPTSDDEEEDEDGVLVDAAPEVCTNGETQTGRPCTCDAGCARCAYPSARCSFSGRKLHSRGCHWIPRMFT